MKRSQKNSSNQIKLKSIAVHAKKHGKKMRLNVFVLVLYFVNDIKLLCNDMRLIKFGHKQSDSTELRQKTLQN